MTGLLAGEGDWAVLGKAVSALLPGELSIPVGYLGLEQLDSKPGTHRLLERAA